MGRLVVDRSNSEDGLQRRRSNNGRLIHCCCICGRADVWGETWSAYYSLKELDDGKPIPKFCSEQCRSKAGPTASQVTEEMKRVARDAEWREPKLAYREMTEKEKYREALNNQRRGTPA